ncbi:uncharacterized protein LOC135152180 [Daucus carota subsp. sativus]|uniref:uncharacterized protein LOC135152180 n=1 Tax=Daucus carota subsp. sativus TaxID=79200 RepID=UPI0030835A1C
MSLDDIFGRLKTYELEMEQRNKRHGGKLKPVALKVQGETAVKNKGKTHVTKTYTESSNSDDDSNSDVLSDSEDSDTEMMQLAALKVKSFKKMAYKNFNKGKKFSRKDRNSDKKGFKKNEGKEEKSGNADKSKYTCFNCGEKGHFATECKKAKNEKGQAFITKKGSWADSSDSEEEVNYALMANTDNSSEAFETKVPHSTLSFNTEDITELRLFLKSLHISYRDQTLENERLKSEVLDVKKNNDYLEKELVQMLEVQKERDDSVFIKNELVKKNASLESELAREKEIIRTWTNSGKTTQNILGSGNWKKGLGYTNKNEAESLKQESIIIERPKVAPVRFAAESEIQNKSKTDKPKQLRFEDEEAFSDSINSDSEIISESVIPNHHPQAHAEGEHNNHEHLEENDEELSDNSNSDADSSNSDRSLSENNESTSSGGASVNQNAHEDNMNHGGEASEN